MAHKNLYKAIIDKLRTDNSGADSLVSLTEYSVSNYSIGRDMPMVKDRTPFLGVKIVLSVPLIEEATTRIQTASVELVAHARSELTALKIADRLEYLVHETQTSDTEFYNFSDANVSNRQTMFVSREAPNFDENTDVWSVQVELDVIWINQPCS